MSWEYEIMNKKIPVLVFVFIMGNRCMKWFLKWLNNICKQDCTQKLLSMHYCSCIYLIILWKSHGWKAEEKKNWNLKQTTSHVLCYSFLDMKRNNWNYLHKQGKFYTSRSYMVLCINNYNTWLWLDRISIQSKPFVNKLDISFWYTVSTYQLYLPYIYNFLLTIVL